MTGVREHLTDLTQIGDVEVVLGDDRVVKAFGCGTSGLHHFKGSLCLPCC
jgi:hypothetical protein